MDVVNRTFIQEYAKRNTSPKMPIEGKFVEAFLDSLLNSTSIQEAYTILSDEMQNGDAFIIYNSFFPTARNLNREPYRSIIAYSMLKKDFRLFELISASLFTGSVTEYHGTDLYTNITYNTDEIPTVYTDAGAYTDMSPGIIQMGFKNYFCDDPLDDGTGSEYQTLDELYASDDDFAYIITLTKPARVQVLEFYVPWCFMSGDENNIYTCGINLSDPYLSMPFGDELSMNILSNMNVSELLACYSTATMVVYKIINDELVAVDKSIEYERTVKITQSFVYFDYDFRCQSSSDTTKDDSEENTIWGEITLKSNAGGKIYAKETAYKPDEEYYEKYNPIMLRLEDNNPDSPCLAFEIQNDTPTIGAMLYIREESDSDTEN